MKSNIKLIKNDCKREEKLSLKFLSKEVVDKVYNFHKSFPIYKATPLARLPKLADILGINKIYVKDESYRFGLNAFKVLGGSYAIGNYLAGSLNKDISEMPFEVMTSKEIKDKIGDVTFVTATDGNHGRGVAWTANQLKQKSVVYMPKGSAIERLENIRKEGAQADITDMNYDDAVRLANDNANKYGWVMVQDTAWDGYEQIPEDIIKGYTTMAQEVADEIEEAPTHIFVQAGVGSLAAAVTGYFSHLYSNNKPIITIIEPNKADCVFKTADANDDKLHFVTGDMDTLMAGLACGEPCSIGWEVIRDYADYFISCNDELAAKGMRILGNPPIGDDRVISGESGAATLGCVAEILLKDEYKEYKETLKLDEKSRVLFFSTEGDTDRQSYLDIVWDGKFQS